MSCVAGYLLWVIFKSCCMEEVRECSRLPSTDRKSWSRNGPPGISEGQILILCPSIAKVMSAPYKALKFCPRWADGASPQLVTVAPEHRPPWGKVLEWVASWTLFSNTAGPQAQPCHSALTQYQQISESSFSFLKMFFCKLHFLLCCIFLSQAAEQ